MDKMDTVNLINCKDAFGNLCGIYYITEYKIFSPV
jgi:hypothetical protein